MWCNTKRGVFSSSNPLLSPSGQQATDATREWWLAQNIGECGANTDSIIIIVSPDRQTFSGNSSLAGGWTVLTITVRESCGSLWGWDDVHRSRQYSTAMLSKGYSQQTIFSSAFKSSPIPTVIETLGSKASSWRKHYIFNKETTSCPILQYYM